MNPFVEQLADLARTQRTRTKWVFLPDTALKWTLSERLLHGGQPWANFRFVTPFELALESAAPDLLARGLNPKPEGLGPTLIDKLMLELPKKTRPHFKKLLDQPGLAEALWATLKEIRMAGLTHKQVGKVLSPEKKPELTALCKAYEGYLESHKLADRAVVYQYAERTPVAADDLLLEFPSTHWAPLEREFLARLPGEKLLARAPDLELPRRLQGTARQRVQTPDLRARFFHAGRRDSEVLEVLRRIQHLKLDQVELACADPDAFPLIRDKLAVYELPATFEPGLPVAVSRPGQAFLGILTWIEHRYSAFDLRELLLSELLKPRELPPWTAGSLLARSEATWERETYHRQLGNLRAWLTHRATLRDEDPGPATQQVDQLAAWIASLFKRLPVDSRGEADWATWVSGLKSILEQDVATPSPNDQAARRRLVRALDELLLLEGMRWSVEETVRSLRQKLEVLEFGGSRALPGHLHVTTLDRVGLTGRPHVYILALEEGRLNLNQSEDPVLTDRERQALHSQLARSADRADERLFTIRERMATLEGEVTLSYSTRDLRSGQELLPSWLFFEAARRVEPLDSYEALSMWLGEPVGYAHAQGAGETEWWLAHPGRSLQVLEAFPHLAEGVRASQERCSERFTVYDGWAPSAAGVLDPRKTGEPISVSRLEGLAACPFRYFLERGLRLRPPDLSRPDPDRWLDEATRGQVLHAVFARFHRDLRSRGWRPALERDAPRLRELLDQTLQTLWTTLPPPSESIARSETRLLHRDVDCFLRLECQDSSRTPLAFEVAFGQEELEDESLARVEPVEVAPGLLLRGRIDRIDRLPDGLEVVDYKTGRRLKTGRGATYEGGRLLQHALYALVVEKLTGEHVMGASYYFPCVHAYQERVTFPYPDVRALNSLLGLILEPLVSGAFLHTESQEKDCVYCDLKPACRAHSEEAAKGKLDNAILAYRRRASEVQ